MRLKEIFSRLQPAGPVNLSPVVFSKTYSMNDVDRYYDPSTGHAYDVTKTINGKRMWRQTTIPAKGAYDLASFDGSKWIEEPI